MIFSPSQFLLILETSSASQWRTAWATTQAQLFTRSWALSDWATPLCSFRSRDFSENPLGISSFRANPHVASQPTTTKPTAGTHPSVSFRGFATADDEPDRNPNCRW